MLIWPFPPLNGFTESLNWLTDIIRTQKMEQRIALRSAPRTQYTVKHRLTTQQFVAAQEILRSDQPLYVPGWPFLQFVGTVQPGNDVTLNCVPGDMGLEGNSQAILWQSSTLFEQVTVSTVRENTATITGVSGRYSNARLMPLYGCVVPDGMSANSKQNKSVTVALSLELMDVVQLFQASYAQYRGLDVLDSLPIVGGTSLGFPFRWQLQTFDNTTGVKEKNTFGYLNVRIHG